MNPDTLLKTIHDDLAPWCQANRGLLSVAADPWNFLELLAESPQGWRAVLHWGGDSNFSEHALGGCILENELSIGVSCHLGLTANPEAAIFRDRPGGTPPLLALVAALRDRLRGLVIDTGGEDTERYFHYRGCAPVALPDGTPLRAYALRFSFTAAPPAVVYRE